VTTAVLAHRPHSFLDLTVDQVEEDGEIIAVDIRQSRRRNTQQVGDRGKSYKAELCPIQGVICAAFERVDICHDMLLRLAF